MSWGAVIGGAAALGSAYLGSKGSGKPAAGVSALQQDPNMYSMLYGQGAIQPKYDKKGRIKNQAEIDAARATAQGGLYPAVTGLLNQNPSGLNQTQTSALAGITDYLTSPASLAGQQASQQVANSFLGQLSNAAPQQNLASNPIDWNAIRSGFGADLSRMQGMLPAAVSAPQNTAPAQIAAGGGVGGLGLNYQDAATRALSGQVDSPYLSAMARNAGDLASQNYARNIAPVTRAGARQTGMYGSSRQGIAEGIAQGDLNRAITDANTSLFGNAYEAAQARSASMAGQLAGLDTSRSIANAQLGASRDTANAQLAQQASLANQQASLQAALANQQAGLQGAGMLADYDLGRTGLGLQAGGQQAQYDLGLRGLGLQGNQLASQNAIAGAGLANQAAQIPLANLQNLFGVGQTMQQAPWAQYGQYASLLNQAPGSPGSTSYQQPQQASSGQMYGGLLNIAGGIGSSLYDQYMARSNASASLANSAAANTALGLGQLNSMKIQPITGFYPY